MKSLLEKLRNRRHRPLRSPPSPRDDRRVWLLVTLGLIAGLGLLFWSTSARIVGEPIEVSYGPASPIFMDSLGPVLGAEFTGGNRAQLLSNGNEFFPAMLDAINAATKSTTLETYIWSSGKISDQFIAALTEKARHGVKVHVLVDGFGAIKMKDSDQHRLLDAGVQFLMFGREHWYQIKPNVNHRTHRKLLIVDGRVGFTGGMCIDDDWLGNADAPDRWREIQIRLEGPVVRQMQAVFAANWLTTTSRLLVGPEYFPAEVVPREGSIAQCYKSGPGDSPENARISYLMAIAAARKSIRISHAYFVPDDLAIEMLLAARRRGVQIDVIVPAHNDSRFGRAASRSRWGELLASGVQFHRYKPAMYHPKAMLVDDIFFTIGSVNFDNRSFGINDEVNVNVLDRDVVRAAQKLFEDDLAHSEPLTLEEFRARPWWQKVIDHFCGLFRSQL
ncbi:MAG TPA: phospholipase D-like domain-containing protein [Candidatus Didemnitutus sp.]|nr:phospholipase D-like domain-containing protein [Candidatus Didemnitutus sp.]